MENCVRCGADLENVQAVTVFLFAQTLKIKPRQKSAARRLCFCSPCVVALAMDQPPDGALNLAAYHILRDLVGAERAVVEAAWENLHKLAALAPAGGQRPAEAIQ